MHERKAVAGTLQHWLDLGKGITRLAGAALLNAAIIYYHAMQ